MIYPISQFVPDPNNARVHNAKNLASIKESLATYGQTKPIVATKGTNVVIAGNGTLEAAKALGWTEIAATYPDLTPIEATGYGIADNRTAELARWDFQVVARLDKLLLEAGHPSIGWSDDELAVLRAAEWTPPEIDDTFGQSEEKEEDGPLLLSFTAEQGIYLRGLIKTLAQGKPHLSDLKMEDAIVAALREVLDPGSILAQPAKNLPQNHPKPAQNLAKPVQTPVKPQQTPVKPLKTSGKTIAQPSRTLAEPPKTTAQPSTTQQKPSITPPNIKPKLGGTLKDQSGNTLESTQDRPKTAQIVGRDHSPGKGPNGEESRGREGVMGTPPVKRKVTF